MEKFSSVFSNYLAPIGVKSGTKPSQVYDQLRIAYNQGVKGILECERVFVSQEDGEVDYDIIYEIWNNPSLHNILVWVNKKIILPLNISTFQTIGVRLRIATGMLNKICAEGKISKNLCIKIHNNFIQIVNRELSAIVTEDLPF